MNEFRSRIQYTAGVFLLGSVLFATGGSLTAYFAMHGRTDPSWNRPDMIASRLLILVIMPIMAATGLYFIRVFADSLSVYAVDDIAITRRSWNGVTTILWKNVRRIDMIGRQAEHVNIVDREGREMRLNLSVINDPDEAFRTSVQTHIADSRPRLFDEISDRQQTLRPQRKAAIGLFRGMAVLFAIALILLIAPQIVPGTLYDRLPYIVILFVLGAAFGMIGIVCIARTITLTESQIVDHGLLVTKRIPLDKIDAVSIRIEYMGPIGRSNSSYEIMTVRGMGHRITLTEFDSDYSLVRDYLRSHISVSAQNVGINLALTRARRSASWGVFGVSLGLLAMVTVIGYMCCSSALGLWRQHRIDENGLRTTARVIGASLSGSYSSPDYEIRYAFNIDGRDYTSSSPVTRRGYNTARLGDSILIEYLPSDPTICRAAQSTVHSDAPGSFYGSAISLGIVIFFVCATAKWMRQEYDRQVRPYR